MSNSKLFHIKCFHRNGVQFGEQECPDGCTRHCDGEWHTHTLAQAQMIFGIHHIEYPTHEVKIFDDEGNDVTVNLTEVKEQWVMA